MQRRRWLYGALGAAAAMAGAAIAWRRTVGTDDGVPSELWSLEFERPGGGKLAMAGLRGRPLLINFWATWCAPCLRELPEIDRWYREHNASGWQAVGLAVDSAQAVQSYLARAPLAFPVGLAGMEGTDLVHQLGNVQGALPFSVVISADGRVLHRKLGETSHNELSRWARNA